MRYRDDELKRVREVMQASIGKHFQNADFEQNISTSIRFKTQALRESRLRFESNDSYQHQSKVAWWGFPPQYKIFQTTLGNFKKRSQPHYLKT